jgi:transcription initiation factor TFIID subunit 3
MTTPQSLHHSLLRPCVLHILRAAGYHSTRPSVLDTLTDLAAKYMIVLAQAAAKHMEVNNTELDFTLNLTIQDVRMAMQDCGALLPQKSLEEEEFEGEEDMRGVENFVAWATGKVNREIRRVALEGADAAKEDYLTGMCTPRYQIFLTFSSPQEEAWYNGRGIEIYGYDLGEACRATSC